MITILRRRVARKFGSLPWRSRSHHDISAKSCPAHNFVIWSWILKLFHINDHHIKMVCYAQHFGRYLEGQAHSMTFQQNRVWPITLLFEIRFYNCFWQTTLCPIPIQGALLGSTGSCYTNCHWFLQNSISLRSLKYENIAWILAMNSSLVWAIFIHPLELTLFKYILNMMWISGCVQILFPRVPAVRPSSSGPRRIEARGVDASRCGSERTSMIHDITGHKVMQARQCNIILFVN